MKRVLILFAVSNFLTLVCVAQPLTIDDCMRYAARNFGRGIDPATNAYTGVTTFNNAYGISGSMPLFDGLPGINTVQQMRG